MQLRRESGLVPITDSPLVGPIDFCSALPVLFEQLLLIFIVIAMAFDIVPFEKAPDPICEGIPTAFAFVSGANNTNRGSVLASEPRPSLFDLYIIKRRFLCPDPSVFPELARPT